VCFITHFTIRTIEVHTAFVRIKLMMMMIYGDGDHGGMQVFEGAANVLHSAARVPAAPDSGPVGRSVGRRRRLCDRTRRPVHAAAASSLPACFVIARNPDGNKFGARRAQIVRYRRAESL